MNQGNAKQGVGRTIGGIALGVLLALITPLFLIAEIFSLTTVLLPAVALVALYRWAGRGPALLSAALTFAFSAMFGGVSFMLMVALMSVLPLFVLMRWQDRPFFEQMRLSIALFGVGMLAAVAVLFFSFGGNMIQRIFGQLPAMVRALPEEYVAPMLESLSSLMGRPLTLDAFYELYDSMIAEIIPMYQLYLPQSLFSGALLSALLCVWLSNRMRARRGEAAPGTYVPLRGWALPASTTGGLLLLLVASWLLDVIGVKGAATVYYAAYGIACVAFSAQTLGSAARRLRLTSLRPGAQRGLLVGIALACAWLPDAALVYGGASAILGSRGAIRQRNSGGNDDGRFGGEK